MTSDFEGLKPDCCHVDEASRGREATYDNPININKHIVRFLSVTLPRRIYPSLPPSLSLLPATTPKHSAICPVPRQEQEGNRSYSTWVEFRQYGLSLLSPFSPSPSLSTSTPFPFHFEKRYPPFLSLSITILGYCKPPVSFFITHTIP